MHRIVRMSFAEVCKGGQVRYLGVGHRTTKGQLLDLAKHDKWAYLRRGDGWAQLPWVATKQKLAEVQTFSANTPGTSSFHTISEQMFRVKATGSFRPEKLGNLQIIIATASTCLQEVVDKYWSKLRLHTTCMTLGQARWQPLCRSALQSNKLGHCPTCLSASES